jgi:acyl-CoA dehydrogenase
MNIRGGNGYVEEWVNARLLRDSYLGAIWEGSTNVVALDVQRAILKDGCLEPLAAYVTDRLDTVTDPRAKLIADAVRGALAEVQERVAAWPALAGSDAEVEARPVAETLYHVVAGGLLLEHGQALATERGDYRTFLVAAVYTRKYLRPPAPPAPLLPPRALDHLAALIDWTPLPADALTGDLLGHR